MVHVYSIFLFAMIQKYKLSHVDVIIKIYQHLIIACLLYFASLIRAKIKAIDSIIIPNRKPNIKANMSANI